MRVVVAFTGGTLACVCGIVLGAEEDRASSQRQTSVELSTSVVFRASFDDSATADIAGGDQRIYTAESLERENPQVGLQTNAVRWEDTKGSRRGALHFRSPTNKLVYFKGDKNLPYRDAGFEGSVSFWLKLSPGDLPKGYVDPLQLTDKKWNDASMFVDFDQSAQRPFRLGFFSDYRFWNSKDARLEDIPDSARPMISVTDWPFDKDRWTHVAFTWSKVNTDEEADVILYLDAKRQGTLRGRQQFSWEPSKTVIMLGINYVGWIDDLIVLNRALVGREVAAMASLGAD